MPNAGSVIRAASNYLTCFPEDDRPQLGQSLCVSASLLEGTKLLFILEPSFHFIPNPLLPPCGHCVTQPLPFHPGETSQLGILPRMEAVLFTKMAIMHGKTTSNGVQELAASFLHLPLLLFLNYSLFICLPTR